MQEKTQKFFTGNMTKTPSPVGMSEGVLSILQLNSRPMGICTSGEVCHDLLKRKERTEEERYAVVRLRGRNDVG